MFTEDLSVYFQADELGDLCVVGGVDVVGHLNRAGGIVEGVQVDAPVLVIAASDAPAVDHGTAVTAPKVGGTAYTVRQVLQDGTGRLYTLILEED